MESSDHGLVSIEVERIAYAAIGRHLRVMCFLCLLLLVLGFLIGHHVANLHSRALARDLEGREETLRGEITKLTSDIAALRIAELEGTRRITDLQGHVARQESDLSEARKEIESAHSLRQSQVVDAIEQMEADRRALLRELKPYEEQNRPLPAHIVSGAVSRVADAQRGRLNRLIESPIAAPGSQCPVDVVATLPLVPVSEAGPSPTIAPGSVESAPETKPAVASEEIDLFAPPAKVEALAPVTAPPPPPESPILAKPAAPFAPAPAPVTSGLAAAPVPAPAAAPAVVAPAPVASAPSPAVIPATGIIDSVPLQELHGQGASPLTPDARRGRTTLFFTPTRKNPANSVPAIPITAPAPTQTTSAPPAKLR